MLAYGIFDNKKQNPTWKVKNNQITMKFNLLTEAENKDTSSRTDYKTH